MKIITQVHAPIGTTRTFEMSCLMPFVRPLNVGGKAVNIANSIVCPAAMAAGTVTWKVVFPEGPDLVKLKVACCHSSLKVNFADASVELSVVAPESGNEIVKSLDKLADSGLRVRWKKDAV